METSTSLASGPGGKPLGTEGLPSLPGPAPRTDAGASGRLFAREVERAVERSRGQGSQAKRLAELEDARRAERHDGFGKPRADEAPPAARSGEALATELAAIVPGEPAPRSSAGIRADTVPAGATDGAPCAPEPCAPAGESGPGAAIPAGAVEVPARATPAGVASAAGAPPAVAATPRPVEAPVELALPERAGTVRLAKPTQTPAPLAGADVAQLERASEILRQIQAHVAPGMRRIALELAPAELGRLSIQLALRTGRLAAIVRAESAETLELLQRHEDELQRVLARRGLDVASLRFELGFGPRADARGRRAGARARPPRTRAAAPPLDIHA
jgi:hypothetical protein